MNKLLLRGDLNEEASDNMAKLSEAYNLLKQTTEQVTKEAYNTAEYIKNQLTDSNWRFFSVIDAVNDIILIKDCKGRWKTLNKFGQSLYKFNKEDYFNKTDREILAKFPQYRETFEYCIQTDEKAWSSGKSHREIEIFTDDKKQVHYFDVIKTPTYNDDKSKKELIVIGRDITEIQESDFKYKAFSHALNAASDNIFIIDKLGVVIMCNDAVIKTFGFTSHKCIEGHPISIIGSNTTSKAIFADLWTTVKNNNIWTGVIINKHISEALINCKVTAIPVMNGSPEPIYYICIMKIIKPQ